MRPRMPEGMIVAKGLKCWKKIGYPAMDDEKGEGHIFEHATDAYHMSGGTWWQCSSLAV